MSVGDVAARLGVTPSAVRMWGSRYGLTASARSAGGHRRYTTVDLDRLLRMQRAVMAGTDPAAAAAAAMAAEPVATEPVAGEQVDSHLLLGGSASVRTTRRGGPGGAVLAVPGAGKVVRGLARAASRLDEVTVTEVVLRALEDDGTVATWNALLRPVLVAAGEHWQRTGSGIEVEHLLTQAVTTAFSQYLGVLPKPPQVAPVVIASSPGDDHVLALYAVRAGLAERGVPVRFLGPRTPIPAVAGTARLIRAPAALIWMTIQTDLSVQELEMVRAAHRRLVLLVGGPGWTGLDTGPASVCTSLEEAIDLLGAAWTAAR